MVKTLRFQDGGSLYLTDEPDTLQRFLREGAFAVPVESFDRGSVSTSEHDHCSERFSSDFPHTDYAVMDLNELLETAPRDGGDLYLEGRDFIPESLRRIYLRLKHLPWEILETRRLLLRETTVADVDAFYELYKDPLITQYMEDLYEDPEEERRYTEDYIRNIYGFYEFGIWTVIEKASGAVIGRAGLNVREGYEDPELGFMIGVPYQRKGYAKEALTGILDYAENELGIEKLLAFVRPGNEVSLHLLYSLGFRESGETELNGIPHRILIRHLKFELSDGDRDVLRAGF